MELGFGKKNKAFIHFLFQECWFNSIHQNISFIYLSYTWKTAWISFVNSYFLCKFFWVCLVSFYFCPSVFTKQPWDSPAVWKKEIKTWWVLRIWGGGGGVCSPGVVLFPNSSWVLISDPGCFLWLEWSSLGIIKWWEGMDWIHLWAELKWFHPESKRMKTPEFN